MGEGVWKGDLNPMLSLALVVQAGVTVAVVLPHSSPLLLPGKELLVTSFQRGTAGTTRLPTTALLHPPPPPLLPPLPVHSRHSLSLRRLRRTSW